LKEEVCSQAEDCRSRPTTILRGQDAFLTTLEQTQSAGIARDLDEQNLDAGFERDDEEMLAELKQIVGAPTASLTSGTRPTFSGYRVQVRSPAHCRRSGLNVGSPSHSRRETKRCRRSQFDPKAKLTSVDSNGGTADKAVIR